MAEYKAFRGTSATTYDTVFQVMINECCQAVIDYCKNGYLEEYDYTLVLDAPSRPRIYLPHFPIEASTLEISLNLNANGNEASFTADDMMEAYTDYVLQTGPNDNDYSYSGLVTFLNGPVGQGNWVRPIYSLSTRLEATRGALLVEYTAGWATIPQSLKAAICLLVSKLFRMRKAGTIAQSESWNGYSASWQTPLALLQGDPTIRALLKPFTRGIFIGGYTGSM